MHWGVGWAVNKALHSPLWGDGHVASSLVWCVWVKQGVVQATVAVMEGSHPS